MNQKYKNYLSILWWIILKLHYYHIRHKVKERLVFVKLQLKKDMEMSQLMEKTLFTISHIHIIGE